MRPPRSRWAVRQLWRAHRVIWNLSGGRLGTRAIGMPVLELVTTGHRSGDPRSVLVTYLNSPTGVAIAGSNVGAPSDPGWAKNLRAHPEARVRQSGRWRNVRARFLEGQERADVWKEFLEYADYPRYDEMTERQIPVVALEPD